MIKNNVKELLAELPPGVELVAAAKTRTSAEILEAIDAGVKIIGQNYVQEAGNTFQDVGRRARWHFIGHLQRNKAKKAVEIFDMIETVDSYALAEELDKRSAALGKTIDILIEINSGREPQKYGIFPEEAEGFNQIARAAAHWTGGVLREDNKRYLENLPLVVVEDDVTIVHASPREPRLWDYILTHNQAKEAFDFSSPFTIIAM